MAGAPLVIDHAPAARQRQKLLDWTTQAQSWGQRKGLGIGLAVAFPEPNGTAKGLDLNVFQGELSVLKAFVW